MTRTIVTMITASVLALIAAGCGSDSDPADRTDGFAAASGALCTATAQADADPAGARDVFFDNVHQPLHELADDTAERDRSVAARLLQTKQAVEAAFDTDSPTTASTLENLVAATDEALQILDRPGLDCEQP